MPQGRKYGSKKKIRSASELIEVTRASMAVVTEAAKSATERLAVMGFEGFSAKMLLADVNLSLEEQKLPVLTLAKLKYFLKALGYSPREVAYQPLSGTEYSAWTLEQK